MLKSFVKKPASILRPQFKNFVAPISSATGPIVPSLEASEPSVPQERDFKDLSTIEKLEKRINVQEGYIRDFEAENSALRLALEKCKRECESLKSKLEDLALD